MITTEILRIDCWRSTPITKEDTREDPGLISVNSCQDRFSDNGGETFYCRKSACKTGNYLYCPHYIPEPI